MRKKILVVGVLLLALAPATAAAKCQFACINHRLAEAKGLHLNERLEETEASLASQRQTISALERRVGTLETWNAQIAAQAAETASRLAFFRSCFGEVPISQYGQEAGPLGYVFQFKGPLGIEALTTTALDVTYDPDPVGAWLWVNACNRERISAKSRLRSYSARFIQSGD